ncbi:hypothetical protein, partial [Staphylococcus shinii]|uniref:hypothetical protein n=1 Tax=Staphylococcus shinii TaxID=2912228 RepID=UPI003CE8281C
FASRFVREGAGFLIVFSDFLSWTHKLIPKVDKFVRKEGEFVPKWGKFMPKCPEFVPNEQTCK